MESNSYTVSFFRNNLIETFGEEMTSFNESRTFCMYNVIFIQKSYSYYSEEDYIFIQTNKSISTFIEIYRIIQELVF